MINEDLDNIEKNLEDLEPGLEEYIHRRIHHIPFAKVIYWLYSQEKKGHEFINVKDLAKFMKITKNRSYEILNGLCEVSIMKRKFNGGIIEYWFEVNGNKPVIEKYVECAKKTLGLI